jgi:hypothetical protein
MRKTLLAIVAVSTVFSPAAHAAVLYDNGSVIVSSSGTRLATKHRANNTAVDQADFAADDTADWHQRLRQEVHLPWPKLQLADRLPIV